MKTSKKSVLSSSTIPYEILRLCNEGYYTNYDFSVSLNLPKQKINYWLAKLIEEGFLERKDHGFYNITWEGKDSLRTYESDKTKDLVRLENMRYKFPILDGLDCFLKTMTWNKVTNINNMDVYHGNFEGFTITVYAGSKNPSFEITCVKRYGVDIYEMMYEARQDVEAIAKWLERDFHLKLGMCEPSMAPEWAIPSPIAESILKRTCSSQIRIPRGIINRSKGRNADLETRDIRLAHEIFCLPDRLQKITLGIEELKSALGWRNGNNLFL